MKIRRQKINAFACLSCVLLLAFAIFLQVVYNLQPCPICLAQRIIILFSALIFLISAGVVDCNATMIRLMAVFNLFLSALGIYLSIRYVWIVYQPIDSQPPCLGNISYLFQILPFTKFLKLLLEGSSSCGRDQFKLFGLYLPVWSGFWFIVYMVISYFHTKRIKIE